MSTSSIVVMVGCICVFLVAMGTLVGFICYRKGKRKHDDVSALNPTNPQTWINEYSGYSLNSVTHRNPAYWYAENPHAWSSDDIRRIDRRSASDHPRTPLSGYRPASVAGDSFPTYHGAYPGVGTEEGMSYTMGGYRGSPRRYEPRRTPSMSEYERYDGMVPRLPRYYPNIANARMYRGDFSPHEVDIKEPCP